MSVPSEGLEGHTSFLCHHPMPALAPVSAGAHLQFRAWHHHQRLLGCSSVSLWVFTEASEPSLLCFYKNWPTPPKRRLFLDFSCEFLALSSLMLYCLNFKSSGRYFSSGLQISYGIELNLYKIMVFLNLKDAN